MGRVTFVVRGWRSLVWRSERVTHHSDMYSHIARDSLILPDSLIINLWADFTTIHTLSLSMPLVYVPLPSLHLLNKPLFNNMLAIPWISDRDD